MTAHARTATGRAARLCRSCLSPQGGCLGCGRGDYAPGGAARLALEAAAAREAARPRPTERPAGDVAKAKPVKLKRTPLPDPWPAPSTRARIVEPDGDLPAGAARALRGALAACWPTAIATTSRGTVPWEEQPKRGDPRRNERVYASHREVDVLVLWLDDGTDRCWARWERPDGETWKAAQAVRLGVRAIGISDVVAWATRGVALPGLAEESDDAPTMQP